MCLATLTMSCGTTSRFWVPLDRGVLELEFGATFAHPELILAARRESCVTVTQWDGKIPSCYLPSPEVFDFRETVCGGEGLVRIRSNGYAQTRTRTPSDPQSHQKNMGEGITDRTEVRMATPLYRRNGPHCLLVEGYFGQWAEVPLRGSMAIIMPLINHKTDCREPYRQGFATCILSDPRCRISLP